uniref:Uncharacterized protein n=1 Tax=viral metagenome TaxID=1070528 RepID=A0A6C0E891_9ZZZZ
MYIAIKYFRYRKDSSINSATVFNSLDGVIEYAYETLSPEKRSKTEKLYIAFYKPRKPYKSNDITLISPSELDINTSIYIENALCEIVIGNDAYDDEEYGKCEARYGYSSYAIIVYEA